GLGACLSKAHVARGPEAHFARSACPRVAEDPALALRGTHLQVEAPTIAVVSRRLGPLERLRREPVHFAAHTTSAGPFLPPFLPTLDGGTLPDRNGRVKTPTRTS